MSLGLEPGAMIAERYSLVRLLGEGGMGSVWAATHVITRKPVALKFLKGDAALDPAHVRRFLREARAASAVRHPNVVQIHDIIEFEGGAPAMVMDLLSGESLGDRLARTGPIALPELATLLVPVVSAIGTAHSAGIIHRDLKPDNIFLEDTPGGVVPKVLDFGIAKLTMTEGEAAQSAQLTQTGAMLGTPYYMAPEQAFGERNIDHRVDIWAFGIILYECLTGRRPVDGDNLGQLLRVLMTGSIIPLAQVASHVPQDVTELVARMLSVKREERPADMREVFAVLRRHTDVRADSFVAAQSAILTSDGHLVRAATGSDKSTLSHTEEAGALASTRFPSPQRSRHKGLALGLFILVLGTAFAGTLLVLRVSRPGQQAVQAAGASTSPSAPTMDLSVSASSSGSALVAVSTASAASASTTPSAKLPVRTTASKTGGTSNARESKGAEPTPTTTAPATPTRLPGGVVSATPF